MKKRCVFDRREFFCLAKRQGDWVRMGDREHGAKGLCQERALVSGLEVGIQNSKPRGWVPTNKGVGRTGVGMMDFVLFFSVFFR